MLTTLISAIAVLQAPVTVPFRIGDNAIIADATVNGRAVSCMFDTGFSGAFVLNDAFNIGKPSGMMTLRDFVGEFQAKTVPVSTLSLGNAQVKTPGLEVVQQPMAPLSESYNTHTDGIMGIEVMKDFVLEINFEHKQFVLHPKSADPIAAKKADGKKSFLIKMLPTGHNSVELPVTTDAGDMMVLALDTGNAFYATTHTDVLQRVNLWPKDKKPTFSRMSWVASGPVPSYDLYMPKLSIWGVPVEGSVWNIIDMASSDANHDGTVGFGFLKNFNITIDIGRRKVFMENFADKVTDKVKATVGLQAFYDPRRTRYTIYGITPGGPAEKAGIKAGDDLLSVDGNELLDRGSRSLETMLEGDQGTAVKLATSRNGQLQRIEVKRQFLVNNMPLQSGQ